MFLACSTAYALKNFARSMKNFAECLQVNAEKHYEKS